MTRFKPKTKKPIAVCDKKITTIDKTHKERLYMFEDDDNLIKKLKKDKDGIKKKLQRNDMSLEDKLDEIDHLNSIKKQIKTIQQKKKNYLLNNSNFIFEYFEEKKNINKGETKKTLINNFFKGKNNANTCDTKAPSYMQKYLSNIDEKHINLDDYSTQTDICKVCSQGELIPVEHDGILVCNHCFTNTPYFVDNDRPSYKEPPKEICFYAYKRINHFREILAQFQAKETTQIPNEVLENVKLQIKKERIEVEQLTNNMAKDILKKLGYNKYYEHIPFIKDKLGIKPPVMSQELEEILCNLFMDIQAPYAKYCPQDRVNFLNYYYTIYKLCELLEQQQFLPYFPMLKDRDKQIEQDEIWKKICDELDWEFIPTI
tara:strand:- start:3807 stop:4925 length:1119 start_codon:yes stop_codon:yes gene_type:complete